MASIYETTTESAISVSGRTYDLVVFHREGDDFVTGDTMVARAGELEAELGEEDCRHILNNQNEIPPSLRGKIMMVFPKWRNPYGTRDVACLGWYGGGWCQDWGCLDDRWGDGNRLVRRRT